MENLPTDIVENIFSRCPLETAFQAKRVCKSWRILLRSKTDKVGLLLAVSYPRWEEYYEKKNKLIYGDQIDDIRGKMMNYSNSYNSLEKLHIGELYMDGMIIGSCNGLVCFEKQAACHLGEPFLVCNPLTGEAVYVPKPNNHIAPCGFGYCHSTNQYKIVRMDYIFEEEKYSVQVYTVGGADKWRHRGYMDESFPCSNGVYVNGALHWLHRDKQHNYTILAFDLEDEKFQSIPLSSRFKDVKYKHHPKLLGGNNLYLVVYDKHYCTDIWAYKRRHNTNNMKVNYNDNNLWHWIKECSIEWEEPYRKDQVCFQPLAITRSDGVLLRYGCKTLYCYDIETKTLNKVFDGCAMGCNMINVIPHANSIVSMSLKDHVKVPESAARVSLARSKRKISNILSFVLYPIRMMHQEERNCVIK